MNTIVPNSGVSGIGQIDLSSMDIETALMMVQQQRVGLLDAQLKDQIGEVQKRNELTGSLNQMQAQLNGMKAALKNDAKPGDRISDSDANKALCNEYAKLATSLGMSTSPVECDPKTGQVNTDKMPKKEDIERVVADIKSKLDTASNSQQMDMLRLQSMSNKRNEAFDVMTNFIKKMQDSRSSIIGNMR
ncbi:hypothetical protein [Bordetella sp. BOR01]|uniref:hypothetical protein n=1 Tax=Bordetella sp. BOR01 TaxID=2854779 RepID=UPI001C4967BC|nr:hypothetical protein [Bordetella sp. BOR01]MBV7485209.1 hypothetical protein [Bordetella sp. BOR01]